MVVGYDGGRPTVVRLVVAAGFVEKDEQGRGGEPQGRGVNLVRETKGR